MDKLKEAVEDEKNPPAREGALLAFECLCERLGRLFEPYVTKILPILLICFGDVNAQASSNTQQAPPRSPLSLIGQGLRILHSRSFVFRRRALITCPDSL